MGDVIEKFQKRINPEKENIPLWSLTVKDGLIPKNAQYNRSFLVKKNDFFNLLPDSYLIYNPMNITLGAIDINNSGKKIAVSGYYIILKIKSNYSEEFVLNNLVSRKSINLYQRFSTGSLTEKQRLQYPAFSKIKKLFPDFTEQKKIGSLLSALNKQITLQQRKVNDLKLIRKAVSQTIFPGNNKTESKILVDKTKEVWKKEKAKNIFKEIDIRKVPNNIILSTTQDGRVVTRESLGRNLLFSQDKLKNYKLVKSGQFIIHLRSFKGGFATSNLVGIVSPTYTIFDFKDKDENDSHFWSILFTRYNFIQSLKSVTEGIRYNGVAIKFSQFADLKITYPTLKTQLKISNLFRSLNNDIEKQEFKITKLQELKQFLLQNMFI